MKDTLGDLQLLVLLALLRLGEEAFSARVRRELADQAGRTLSLSATYVTLRRLEQRGLAESHLVERPGRGGRPVRCFRVTAEGKRLLLATRRATDRMWDGVDASELATDDVPGADRP